MVLPTAQLFWLALVTRLLLLLLSSLTRLLLIISTRLSLKTGI